MKHATATPEQIYDEQIAPKLMALGKECEALGFSLVASCEWTPGETGETFVVQKGASFKMRLAHVAMRAHGNVDALIFWMQKQGRERGHSSVALLTMGVPLKPSETES